MPSKMFRVKDVPPIYGMNSVDDPKTLKPGECVRLLNAFPGNPPKMIPGSISKLLTNTQNYTFVPPGISFEYNSNIYIIAWALNSVTSEYSLIIFDKENPSAWTSLGEAIIDTAPAQFDFYNVFQCIYAIVYPEMSTWALDYKALSHKVIESNEKIRDLCISQQGNVTSVKEKESTTAYFTPGKYLQYAFQYVRRTDAGAFEAGTTPTGMILPVGITGKPKRIDTFLPGSCVGVEYSAYRITQSISITNPAASDLSTGGGAEMLVNFNEAACVDGVLDVRCFDLNGSLATAYLQIDFGESLTRKLNSFGLYFSASGNNSVLKISYSDNGTVWTDATTGWSPSTVGWCDVSFSVAATHRYWRMTLTTPDTAGLAYPTDIRIEYDAGKIELDITDTVSSDHISGILQGATHLRVSRSLEQNTAELAEGATKFFLFDLPLIGSGSTTFEDTTTNATLGGELNQLLTGYSEAPEGCFVEYAKGRLFIMNKSGKVYYSEVPGGDGAYSADLSETYPQAWASLFKPLTYFLDCDSEDGQNATGMKRIGDDLYFFKERKTFALYGCDPLSTNVTMVSNTIGCAFPYTITKCELRGLFGNCLLFLSNEGPMVLSEGGRLRTFSEMKIKELWPDRSQVLYGLLDTDYDNIMNNCSANYFRNTWWVIYSGNIVGYYIDPAMSSGDAPHGPFEFEFAEI